MTETPVVVEATTRQFESWKVVAVVAETLGSSGWALAGGQMVALHLLIAHLPFPRVTIDADTIVDVRVRPDAARLASAGLVGAGWVASGVDNTVHRFTSPAGGIVDILGPDGLRSRPITIPPATTLLAPGRNSASSTRRRDHDHRSQRHPIDSGTEPSPAVSAWCVDRKIGSVSQRVRPREIVSQPVLDLRAYWHHRQRRTNAHSCNDA